MSLRLRLTLFFSLFIAVILAVVSIATFGLTQRFLDQSIRERATDAMQRIDGALFYEVAGLLPSDISWDYCILGYGEIPINSIANLRLFDCPPPPGDVALTSLLTDQHRQQLVDNEETSLLTRLPTGEDIFVSARLGSIYFQSGDQRYAALISVGIPANTYTAALNRMRTALLLTSVGAFIVCALGIWFLSRGVLSPLHRITQTAALVTGADLAQRVPVPSSKDEIGEMAVTLNRMLDRLQESFETQRRFTADASHELRTPVTAIAGHANYLLRRTRPDPEQVDSLTVIRREAERMTKLVNDLLELARADAGFSIELEPMNLVEVAEAVHMEVTPVAGNAEVTVSSSEPILEVMGDPTRLKQVVLNLVMNALNAGATTVSISLSQDRLGVRLEVLDDGPGIPKEAIPHLFERFYRVDGSRSTRGNGSGLGLAIVAWIVQQHDGLVEVESGLGEGTVFRILLPHPRG